jgi:hypothetical protein
MPRAARIMVIAVAACSPAAPLDGIGSPADAGGEVAPGVDAAPDDGPGPGLPDAGKEPTDLAEVCGGRAPVTLEEWEDCYQRRKCEWQVGCVPLNAYRDVQDCIASGDAVTGGRLAADRRDRRRAVDQGRASIDVAAFTQCLLRTSATRCNTALFDVACLTRFDGTVGDHAGCYTDIDCRSPDAVCVSDCPDACCVGTCQPKFTEGQACTTFRSCEPGLQCSNGTCIAGDPDTWCNDITDCDPEAWCDLQAHRCKITLEAGAECTSLLQCGGDTSCIGLSIAQSSPGHCLRDSRPGDPCDGFCHGNLFCDGSGTCRALPALREACSALTPCAGANTICSAGVCVLRSEVGVACRNQTCLPGLFCSAALGDPTPRCTAPGAVGAACADPSHCQSYLCSGTRAKPGSCLAWSASCP